MFKSDYLEQLYCDYNIDELSYGRVSDKLGDVYEDFTEYIFLDKETALNFNSRKKPLTIEEQVFYTTLMAHQITRVKSIVHLEVPKRNSRGAPKTDKHFLVNGVHDIKVSVKQSYARNIAVAEFDVDTIKREVGINDERAVFLMEKHQRDASAKYFSQQEKQELRERISNIKNRLVKWTLSGSPEPSSADPRIANHTIMFKIDRHGYRLKDFSSHTIDEQVAKITKKKCGFGTGLSWTYATGTKGSKIQFKAPVM